MLLALRISDKPGKSAHPQRPLDGVGCQRADLQEPEQNTGPRCPRAGIEMRGDIRRITVALAAIRRARRWVSLARDGQWVFPAQQA